MIKLSDFIAKRLREVYGVDCVFMISGGGAMHLNQSFGKYIPYVCNHHEQASAMAAEGYARVNQKLAVVNITTGPGGLNCLNGVFGQWTDSVPVLYISGQVKTSTLINQCPKFSLRQLGDQEVDIVSCVKPVTKYAVTVKNPNDIEYVLDKAIYLATHGRMGPVWIDVPMDIQAALIDETKLRKYNPIEDKLILPDTDKEFFQMLEFLEESQRPLIIAGHGIRLSGAKEYFSQLVEKLNIPVVTTMNGFDIINDDNPNFIARIGTIANRAGNFVLQNADLIISIGSRNNIRQVSYNWENFAKNGKLVAVDIDMAELNKPTINPFIKINSDAKTFIQNFLKYAKTKKCPEWVDFCKALKKKYPPLKEAKRGEHNPIEPYYFIEKLIEEFDNDELIVSSNGTAFLLPFQVGKVKGSQRYIWNSGDASMGYGLPASIGACCANGKKRTICLEGDGSIMMNLQELQTVITYDLPIKIFVLNNNGYISIRQTQQKFFDAEFVACTEKNGVEMPDFIKLGDAFGIKTFKINNVNDIEKQIRTVLNKTGPVLCEVFLNSDYVFAPKLSARQLPDGTMLSPSLEDLYPFLPREELQASLIDK